MTSNQILTNQTDYLLRGFPQRLNPLTITAVVQTHMISLQACTEVMNDRFYHKGLCIHSDNIAFCLHDPVWNLQYTPSGKAGSVGTAVLS